MAIGINPGFFGGQAAIAGNTQPPLNLKTAPIQPGLFFDRMVQGQQFQQQMSMKESALEEEKRQADMRNQIAQQQMSNQSRELDIKEQDHLLNQSLKEVQILAAKSKEEINKIGSYSAMYLPVYQANSSDPAKLKTATDQYLQIGVKEGILTQEQAEAMSKMPPQQLAQQAQYYTLLADKAKDLKAMSPQGQGGNITITQPDGTVVNVNANQEKLSEETSKNDAETLKELDKQASTAQDQLGKIKEARVANEAFKSGAFATPKLWAGKVLQGLAPELDIFNAPQGERLNKLQMDFAQSRVANAKGAVSDKELDLYLSSVAGISNTQEGNRLILDSEEATTSRKIEQASFKRAWLNKHKTLTGSDEAWIKFTSENPIFSKDKENNLKINRENISNWKDYVNPSSGTYKSSHTGKVFTEADIEAAAKSRNMTTDQVKKQLGVK